MNKITIADDRDGIAQHQDDPAASSGRRHFAATAPCLPCLLEPVN